MTEKEATDWADAQLLNESENFDHISTLSLKGPSYCLKLPSYEFPGPRKFTYIEEFALRTKILVPKNEDEKSRFLNWLSSECMGRDIKIPEVYFGYLIEHYFFECDDLAFANNFLEEQLKILIPKNLGVADEIWASIA
ncbi:hypothetical protein PVT67_06960 [Gallaecimonas kandeliae]|uniref:hypothetical protein n=1 Tax=Gallaecimonas kandeliae TaxID=3029055 RepID=UPI0026472C53|nr:hypothetical protein [Gallaecimonas kandeliae]WKE66969.1 hypothetical protein PVT67_06960 [Gallaecimonas kandeliae]